MHIIKKGHLHVAICNDISPCSNTVITSWNVAGIIVSAKAA